MRSKLRAALWQYGWLFALVIISQQLKAQNNSLAIQEINPSLTACNAADTFRLILTNTSATEQITNVNITVDLPAGINYAGFQNASGVDDSDPNFPIFIINSINPGQSITLKYTARANCSIISTLTSVAVTNTVNISYTFGSSNPSLTISPKASYEIKYADLSLQVMGSANLSSNIGVFHQRNLKIINGGSGAIDTVVLIITMEPEVDFINLTTSNNTIIPYSSQNGNTYTFIIAGNDLFAASNNVAGNSFSLDPDEELHFIEKIYVARCGSGNTGYKVEWGCEGQVCNQGQANALASSNVTINSGQPLLAYTSVSAPDRADWCAADTGRAVFTIANTSTAAGGFATNLKVDFVVETLVLSNFRVNGVSVNAVQNSATQWTLDFSAINANNLSTVTDIDNDGKFDDLANTASFQLEVDYVLGCLEGPTCPSTLRHRITPLVYYNNQCETSQKYTLNYLWGMFPTIVSPSLISGPTDMVMDQPETFTFCDFRQSNSVTDQLWSCTAEISAEIQVPSGYQLVGNSVEYQPQSGSSYTLSATQTGNGINISGGEINGCYQVDLILSCPGGSTGQGTINYKKFYSCSDTCDSCKPVIGCASKQIYGHIVCASDTGAVPCGILTTAFDVNRVSVGWPNGSIYTESQIQTMGQMSPSGAQAAGANLEKAYVLDTIQSVTTGLVVSSGVQFPQVSISYTAPGTGSNIQAMFNFINGSLMVNGTVCSSAISSPSIDSTLKPLYIMTFDLPACNLNAGDAVTFIANYLILKNAVPNGSHPINDFRSEFSSVIDGERIACDSWGANFRILKRKISSLAANPVDVSCTGGDIEMLLHLTGGESGDEFPNEYRRIVDIDQITFNLPSGYVYVPGTARYLNQAGVAYTISDNSLTMTSDTIYNWTRDLTWPVFDKTGTNGYQRFIIKVKPKNCESGSPVTCSVNVIATEYANNSALNEIRSLNTNVSIRFYKPNLIYSYGLVTQEGYTSSTTWEIEICNQATSAQPYINPAENLWIAVETSQFNQGNISIDSAFALGSGAPVALQFSPNNDFMFIQVGTLGVNACRKIRIQASYTDCITDIVDTLNVSSGWNCGSYPNVDSLDDAICHVNQGQLLLRYKNANLQWTGDTLQDRTYPPCTAIPYAFDLISSAPGTLSELSFGLGLPAGLTIVPGSAQFIYPLNSGNLQPLGSPVTTGSGNLEWNINSIALNNQGLPGSVDTTINKVRVIFELIPGCGYDQSQSVEFYTNGLTNCGRDINLNAVKFIRLDVFEPVDSLAIAINTDDFICTDTTGQVMIKITNIGDSPTTMGKVTVTLPSATIYAGSYDPTYNAPSSSSFVNNGSVLVWDMPQGVAAGDSIMFAFNVTVSKEECRELVFGIATTTERTIICNGDTCNVKATNAFATSSDSLCCFDCGIDASFTADTVCIEEATCFMPADTSTGAIHLWVFGDGSTSTEVSPCHIYLTPGTYSAEHYITKDSCSEVFVMNVIVNEMPEGSIELLGCNPFCEGDTVYLTVNGSYTSIQWVQMPGSIPIEGGHVDTLAVTTGGIYNAILYNGACSDHCLSITLNPQTNPVISVEDASICEGGSTVLDAGAGYTNYLWSNGEITQTITVSDTGLFWVTVGEKLPYGCCTCKGTDTVRVTLNTIDVLALDTIICINDKGGIEVNIAGGFAPYTINVSGGIYNENNTQISNVSNNIIEVSGSGAFYVEVTDSLGCVSGDSAYVAIDNPPVSSFIHNDSTCVNDSVCFVAYGSGNHEWYVNNSLVASGDSVFCYLFPNDGTFDVMHVISNTCGSDSSTQAVTVMPAPILNLNDELICEGDSILLDAGAGYDNYSWSTGDTTQTIWVGAGTYIVNVGQNIQGECCVCSAVDTIIVSVNTIEVIASDTIICEGEGFGIPISIIGGIEPFTVSVYNSYGMLMSITGGIADSLLFQFIKNYGVYWVSVTDSLGCTAGDSVNIGIRYLPEAEFKYNEVTCLNDTACFLGMGGDIDSQQWIIRNELGIVVTVFNVDEYCHVFTQPGPHEITHIVTNECGSDTAVHWIKVVPPVDACIVMLGSNPFCEGDSVLLTVNDPFNQVTEIEWYDHDGNLVFTGDTMVVTQGGTYSAIIKDNNGCYNSCMCIVLNMIPALVVNLPDTAHICTGGSVNLDAGSGYDSYYWNTGETSQAITVNQAGTYSVEVTENGQFSSCSGTGSTVVVVDSVIVNPVSSVNGVLCYEQWIVLSTPFDPNYSYEWYYISNGSVINVGNTSAVDVFPPQPGVTESGLFEKWKVTTYYVKVVDLVTGCEEIRSITVRKSRKTCDTLVFDIAPNPAYGAESINVDYNVNGNPESYISVLDVLGNKKSEHKLEKDNNNMKLDVSDYSSGIYFVNLTVQGQLMQSEKLVIVK